MHYGGMPFDTKDSYMMQDIRTAIDSKQMDTLAKLAETGQTLQTRIDNSTVTTQSKIDASSAALTSTVAASQSAITTSVATSQSAVTSSVSTMGSTVSSAVASGTSQMTESLTREASSRILNEQSFVKSGTALVVRYQASAGLSPAPTLIVYSPRNSVLAEEATMTEVGTTGIYTYEIRFLSTWGTGAFTIICSESTYGTVDGITIDIIRASLDDINSAAVVSMSQLSGLDTSGLSSMSSSLSMVNDSMENIIGTVSDLSAMEEMLDDVAENIKKTVLTRWPRLQIR